MKHLILTLLTLLPLTLQAQVDQYYKQNATQNLSASTQATDHIQQPTTFNPNFHIYLCIGQSNMEGAAPIEPQDLTPINPRFLMMAAVDMPDHNRQQGQWYTAYPPLCRDHTGLTPADYFGRTLTANLPDSITIGIINIAVGGCKIELYDETQAPTYIANSPDWLQNFCAQYNNNPYRRLIECAKKAQQTGTIRGILLHQGCSNNTQPDWPQKVKHIYHRILHDLNLNPTNTPLLAGELLQQNQGGACWQHNPIIATLPQHIPNAHIISSANCPGAPDHLHFTAEGYRILGTRYALTMLQLLKNNPPTTP